MGALSADLYDSTITLKVNGQDQDVTIRDLIPKAQKGSAWDEGQAALKEQKAQVQAEAKVAAQGIQMLKSYREDPEGTIKLMQEDHATRTGKPLTPPGSPNLANSDDLTDEDIDPMVKQALAKAEAAQVEAEAATKAFSEMQTKLGVEKIQSTFADRHPDLDIADVVDFAKENGIGDVLVAGRLMEAETRASGFEDLTATNKKLMVEREVYAVDEDLFTGGSATGLGSKVDPAPLLSLEDAFRQGALGESAK